MSLFAWFWRHLSSRRVRLFYLGILGIIFLSGLALRVEAVLFERRAIRLASALSSLRIGVTSKAEVLSRIPGLSAANVNDATSRCDADECLSITLSNPRISDWVLRPTARAGHGTRFSVLSWWGFRYRTLGAYVNLKGGKVSDLGYHLMLSTPYADTPGVLIIGVSSRRHISGWDLSPITDESPNYQVSHSRKWPDSTTGVHFTPDATDELISHAFALKLRCLWSLAGCRTVNQILPEAEQDRQKIEQAATQRMRGPNQCADHILPRRARDSKDIVLVEVRNASPSVVEGDDGSKYRFASFRLLRVLKGTLGRPLDNIGVAPVIRFGELQAHNSAIDLLNPSQRLLLFSGSSLNIDEPCEAIAGTDSAVQTIERSLGRN